ncbi:MAG TPA: TetR family transcriptional regulator C-terminal domain-containing protein [Desulfuromonadales bacterium]|nr:TetR family transcriptional regulator C-terminal domain-containing protein [Desulfuromonadales bacterium]
MPDKGAVTREKILRTARQLFHAKGFHAVSINDLVDAVRMQKGSLYYHFSSKDDLARAVFAAASDEFMIFLDQTLTVENSATALDNFFSSVLDAQVATGFVGGCLFGNTALEMSDSDADFARMVDEVFENWIHKLADVVEEAQRQNQIGKEFSSRALAIHIIATIEGGIMMSRLQKDETPLRQSLETLRSLLGLHDS